MDLYQTIAAYVAETVAALKAAQADGKLTVPEAFQLFADAVQRLVKQASFLKLPGAEKKAAVMAAVEKLYDDVLAPLDIPYIPEVIERTVVDPALKKLAVHAADCLIELFVKLLPPSGEVEPIG